MGTHPIFESDFDCLTEKVSKMSTLSRLCHVGVKSGQIGIRTSLSRPILRNIQISARRQGGEFVYFVQTPGRQFQWSGFAYQWGYMVKGFLYAVIAGLSCDFIFGVPEGPFFLRFGRISTRRMGTSRTFIWSTYL